MPALIVFDLDGTLIDSQQDLADSANEMLASYAATPLSNDRITAMVGDGAKQLVERAVTAAGLTVDVTQALERFLEIYASRLVSTTRPYPGVPEAIERLRGRATLAVLTNKPEGLSRRVLDFFDLSRFFQRVIGGDSGFPRKPDPAGLGHLIETLGSSPETTVFVGDSMIDVETARQARVTPLVALYGFGRLRAPLALDGTELLAESAAGIALVLEVFLAGTRSPQPGS